MGRKPKVSITKTIEPTRGGISLDMTADLRSYAMAADASTPIRLPFYEIIVIEEMNGRLVLDSSSYENVTNRVFLLCPGRVRSWEKVTNIKGVIIHFSEEFLFELSFRTNAMWELNILKEMSRYDSLNISREELKDVEELLRLILKEYNVRAVEFISSIRAYINIFLIMLYRIYEKGFEGDDSMGYSNICEAFQRLVLLHVGERKSVHFFAKQLNISMGYLNEKVKQQLGITPGEVIRQTMVNEAKRLIANTDLSMTEVAEALGFDDGSYFCRLFKREMGISPIKFRQSCYSLSEGKPGKRKRRKPPKQQKNA